MNPLQPFTFAQPRPLPVIILADTSGSMYGEKIEALNQALNGMLETFAKESRIRAEIQVALVTFGETVQTVLPLRPAKEIESAGVLQATGGTPMGGAIMAAKAILEDKNLIPSRAYRPILVLLSDGQPTDAWEEPMRSLDASERGQKASRMAMAIGADADENVLKAFIKDKEAPIFRAHEARDIHRFFRAVTMSVVTQSKSANPDISQPFELPPMEDDPEL